jgi:hypothetical protein
VEAKKSTTIAMPFDWLFKISTLIVIWSSSFTNDLKFLNALRIGGKILDLRELEGVFVLNTLMSYI